MIAIALEFLRTTKVGQYLLIGFAAASAFGVLVFHERGVGARKVVAKIERQGEKTNAKAQAKREDAERKPDLSRWYRD